MAESVKILGINHAYHELSAVLIIDGTLIAAVEEERFNRIKHSKFPTVNNPDILPFRSIDFCLKKANITINDITHIALSFLPSLRLENIDIDNYYIEGNWGSKKGENLFIEKLLSVPEILSQYADMDLKNRIYWIPHHISHASSAFLVSPFKNACIMSIDGIGEIVSTWLGYGENNNLYNLIEIKYPNSLGLLWEKFSMFLGFTQYDAAKLMSLAAYGNWQKYYRQFQNVIHLTDKGFIINNDIMRFRTEDFSQIEQIFGIQRQQSPYNLSAEYIDLAATLQYVTNQVILHLSTYLSRTTQIENLCLAGGVALNVLSNWEILKSGLFKNIYVQPAAHDAGTALGAAFYVWNVLLNRERNFIMSHPYWGPEFIDDDIEKVLDTFGLQRVRLENIETKVAELLAMGKIIGWFQGRMEWGPRALGNRSLLADPRKSNIKEILNKRIKKREAFRPFAPSVLAEDAHEWFELPSESQSLSLEFMEFVVPVRKDKIEFIPAVIHVDGTCRIQLVRKDSNPKFHKLLSEFKKITGVPILLNTSLNENEPIVCTPYDAIHTFIKTEMDYLVMNNYLIEK